MRKETLMKYDIGNIINDMIEYDCGVPLSVTMGISLIVCAMIVIIYHQSMDIIKFFRNASWYILGGYMSFIFCATVLFREESEEIRYSLRPFLTYVSLYNRRIAEVILNVLMFTPVGFFSGIAIKSTNIIRVTGIGCLLSQTIELFQLLPRRGVCNMDDVIHNTIGGALGYGAFLLCKRVFKKVRIN